MKNRWVSNMSFVIRSSEDRDVDEIKVLCGASADLGADELFASEVAIGQDFVARFEDILVAVGGIRPNAEPHRSQSARLSLVVRRPVEAQVEEALLSALVDQADGQAGLSRLEVTVFADDATAIALLEKVGFRVEATARAYAKRGSDYLDALHMARLR